MVSVGSIRDNIPGVYFNGETYTREILHHLIETHKYRRIAYIAPFLPDRRTDVYLREMRRFGIYDP